MNQQLLKQYLHYDQHTGVFTWLPRGVKSFDTRCAGTEAGTIKIKGRRYCRRINVCGKLHYAHRLAWMYVYGDFPNDEIDHINGNALDNRIENLRDVSRTANCRNMPKYRTSSGAGLVGVNFYNDLGKWRVHIGDNHPTRKGRKFLGHFEDFFEACCARKSAELLYGYHVNHGRN